MAKYVVCTAWPYSNGIIHVGHVAGSLLPPDIFAKFHRVRGNEVLMVSGSDQHGTPVTVRAEKEGVTPEEVAERYHRINKQCIEDLGITYSLFTKTHTENHFEVVHDIFLTLLDKGHLYKKETLQYYCPSCARFLPDRYVEGVCERCGYEHARGDQCENCGATFDPGDLEGPICTNCRTEPLLRETEHYFFRLSELQDDLREWAEGMGHWKQNVKTFTMNWLDQGLNDRAITRDMSWGVPVPLEGWDDKVIYVWFEAVIGYLSASKEWAKIIGRPEGWREFWEDPQVPHYYFLGKDNIPFHTIIWPAILMGYGGLNLAYDVPANEFLTFKGEQFSKSRGWGIDMPSMLERFDPDIIRFYISANMPENRDTDFSWEDFQSRVNNELVATLGNYYHRVLSFTHKHYGEVPPYQGEEWEEVMSAVRSYVREWEDHLSNCRFKKALKAVMDLAQYGNRYFDRVAPWSLVKEDREACGSALRLNMEIVKALAVMSYPYVPHSANRLWSMMGFSGDIVEQGPGWMDSPLQEGQSLERPVPLYSKVSIEMGDSVFGDFESMDLRIGEVMEVKDHPNADKLMVLEVDIGKRIRLVAGLKEHYGREQLEGKRIVVLTNLKPAKLRGIKSQGMLLAADHGEEVRVLVPEGETTVGERVNSNMASSSKQLGFEDFQRLDLRIGEVGGDGKANVGHQVELEAPPGYQPPSKVAVFLPSGDSDRALPLFTENGVPITVDGDISKGARVR
ncbi:MAG: methionine--tRNA ligase [Methanomassiliicoccales archaeon]